MKDRRFESHSARRPGKVLDEPTSHLDVYHQFRVLDLVRDLQVTTIVALHDLNLAAQYCDVLYVLKAGAVVASGRPDTILTPGLLHDVYGVRADVAMHPSTGRPHASSSCPIAATPRRAQCARITACLGCPRGHNGEVRCKSGAVPPL